MCKEEVDDDDGPTSYILLETSMWNGNFREPKVEGKLRKSDVTAAAKAAADFDWDEFKYDVDGKSDSNTHPDSDEGVD
jgi:hypothetical protein